MCTFPTDGANVCEDFPVGPISPSYDPECFTAMNDSDETGQFDALGCDNGCAICPDHPVNLIGNYLYWGRTHAVWSPENPIVRGFWENLGAWGNPRFLHADIENSPDETSSASNTPMHLMANAPQFVKPGASFLLGCCHNNNGKECFGTYSTCNCWDTPSYIVGGNNFCGTTGFHNWMQGDWPDESTFFGFEWPCRGSQTNAFSGQCKMYCRRFTPWDDCSQHVRIWTLAPFTPKHLMTVFIRMGRRFAHRDPDQHSCTSNIFIYTDGYAHGGTPCLDGWAHQPNQNENVGASNNDSGCPDVASRIIFRPKLDDKPRFGDSIYFPLENKNLNKLRNIALDNIFFDPEDGTLVEWPMPGNNESMNFEFLDHEANELNNINIGISHFRRTYDPLGDIPIDEADLKSIFTFNACYTRYGVVRRMVFDWCPKYISISCYYVPVSLRKELLFQPPIGVPFSTESYEVPHVSVEVRVEMHLRLTDPGLPGSVIRNYTNPPSEEPVVISQSGIGKFPTANPDGNRITYRTAEQGPNGLEFTKYSPPSVIQWRGSLSPASMPGSYDFMGAWNIVEGTPKERLKNQLLASACEVGGYPALHGTVRVPPVSERINPAQLWKGRYTVEVGGPTFDSCGL